MSMNWCSSLPAVLYELKFIGTFPTPRIASYATYENTIVFLVKVVIRSISHIKYFWVHFSKYDRDTCIFPHFNLLQFCQIFFTWEVFSRFLFCFLLYLLVVVMFFLRYFSSDSTILRCLLIKKSKENYHTSRSLFYFEGWIFNTCCEFRKW